MSFQKSHQPLIPTANIARVYYAVKEMKAKDLKRWLSLIEIAELASVKVGTAQRHVRVLSKAKVFEKLELIQFLYRLAPDADSLEYTNDLEAANLALNRNTTPSIVPPPPVSAQATPPYLLEMKEQLLRGELG